MNISLLALIYRTPTSITSENVSERYGITRERQDKMAMQSHQKFVFLRYSFLNCGWREKAIDFLQSCKSTN